MDSVPRLRDERLCWLAVRDRLNRSAGRNPVNIAVRVLSVIRLPWFWYRPGKDTPTESAISTSMMRYAVVVDELSQRLTPEERAVLRGTGRVPDWFLPEVRRRGRRTRL